MASRAWHRSSPATSCSAKSVAVAWGSSTVRGSSNPAASSRLKMILEGRFATQHDVLRFENEAEAVAALDHPNVVPILEVGQSERLHYFTMPLLTGGSLAEARCRLAADLRAVARVMIEIAGAVHHAPPARDSPPRLEARQYSAR